MKKIGVIGVVLFLIVAISGYGYMNSSKTEQNNAKTQNKTNYNWEDIVKKAKNNDVLVIIFSENAKNDIEKDLKDAQSSYNQHNPTIMWVDRSSEGAQHIISNLGIQTLNSTDGKEYQVAAAIKKSPKLTPDDWNIQDNAIAFMKDTKYFSIESVGGSKETALKNYFFNPNSQNYKF